MYQKILVPLDGSKLSEAVLPHVRSIAQATHASVLLMCVGLYRPDHVPVYVSELMASGQIEMVDKVQAEVRDYLARIAATLREEGILTATEFRDGPVADMILDTAQSAHADLIAMSTHGRSGLGRWLIGSVADKVVHGSKIPVLLIRPTETAENETSKALG